VLDIKDGSQFRKGEGGEKGGNNSSGEQMRE